MAQSLGASGRQPELGPRDSLSGAEGRAEDPRDEVAPVVEMEVRDGDRVDPRPPVVDRAQAGEHTRPAVEQELALTLHEVARLCAACVRPGGRATDDGEPHRRILPIPTPGLHGV